MKAYLLTLKDTLTTRRFVLVSGSIALLLAQNFIIFWQHYTGSATFLNDFARIIYPMIAFWTSLAQHGIFPEWIPYQTMGMPFVLTMQSGVFYPPLWLFVIFKIPFTLHVAVIVQVLHVLWGAIGCWMYMRLLGRSYGAALFAALAFQFFGGFYSNAEHIDIVRAFSYIPWLFWVTHVTSAQQKLAGRNWFAPLIILFFVTGAYQGNLVAHLFVLGIFWLLSWFSEGDWRSVAKLYWQVAALLMLGILLCSVYLLPTIAVKAYLARDGVWSGQFINWPLNYWNTLIMHSTADGLFVLPSMLSAFVTVPVFCLLFIISPTFIKQNRIWVCITLLACVMASGSNFFIFAWLVKIFPPLGSSRFPSSDYRGIFCFGLILLSSGILDDYLNDRTSQKLTRSIMLCLGLLFFFYLTSLLAAGLSSTSASDAVQFLKDSKVLFVVVWSILMFASSHMIAAQLSEWIVVIALSGVVFFTLHHFRQQRNRVIITLILLEMVSGLYFIDRISIYWRSDVSTDAFYQELDRESPYTVMKGIENPVAVRPACHDMNLFWGSWRGYILGDFMCQTQDSKTRPREVVNANPVINTYMRQAWQPRAIQAAELDECKPEATLQMNPVATQIHSFSYGLQQIKYQVNAHEDFCFVENELQFPGWSGVMENSAKPVLPQAYCGALRSWCLPKGQYQFTTEYRAPWLREGLLASIIFLLIYVGLLVRFFVCRSKPRIEAIH